MIYDVVFELTLDVVLRSKPSEEDINPVKDLNSDGRPLKSQLGLILVNKQIYSEVSPILYYYINFVIGEQRGTSDTYLVGQPDIMASDHFLRVTRRRHLDCITKVTLVPLVSKPRIWKNNLYKSWEVVEQMMKFYDSQTYKHSADWQKRCKQHASPDLR